MINSDGKSQSYNSKYAILSHNVLICFSKLLGQRRWNVGLGETFNLKGRIGQPPKTGLKCTSAAAPTLQQTVACQSCPLSYHMINSDGKSQSYNGKYEILRHNILICLSKLLGQTK